ncbi:hypothetical protein G6L46_10135 [Agrobacterium rhizogenes]|uniref:hypothetical protein n=1 Tax=Rhizobium rhizogenes TaxID=359 RepID=UPI001573D925|nr:hypothetical protein [Rhizobium rhizogenes]NTF87482.1 hypothetical protein [Rhizobium rhizogenes]
MAELSTRQLVDYLNTPGMDAALLKAALISTGLASEEQGEEAETALQPDEVGSAAFEEVSEFASAAQGGRADTAIQPSTPYFNRLNYDSLSAFDGMSSSLAAAIFHSEVTSADAQEITVGVNDVLDTLTTVNGGGIMFPSGKYYLDPQYGISLDTATYNYGDSSLEAALFLPYRTRVRTHGTSTEFCFVNLDPATSVGVAIGEDGPTGSGFSQHSHEMDGFMVRAMGGAGRYGVLHPKNSYLFANKRPQYNFTSFIKFCGSTDNKTVLNSPPEGWSVGVLVGDCWKWDGFITGYGTFNPTTTPVGQHQMTGFKASSAVGAFGVTPKFLMKCLYTGVDISDGVEGFGLTDGEVFNSYYGVVTSNSAREPGGFIDNFHTNTVKEGFRLANRDLIHLGKVECYRADGSYTDGATPWYGVNAISSEVDIGYLAVASGDSFAAEMASSGIYADSASVIRCNDWRARSVYTFATFNGSPDGKIGDGIVNNVANIIAVSNSASDIQGGNVSVRSVTPTNYFTTDGTVDKRRLHFPNTTLIQSAKHIELAPALAGTLTLKPRLTATDYQVAMQAGTAAFTYNIVLDHASAIDGDEVSIKLVGSSSTNPTVNIYSDSTSGTLLSTFNNIGGATRLSLRYVYSSVSNLWREVIMTSLDATY